MDFDLSEEQRLLKESVDGLLTDSYDFDARKKYAKEKGGWSKAVWGKLAEQGLLGLPFAEADGGFGAGAVGDYKPTLAITKDGRTLVYKRKFFFGGADTIIFPVASYGKLKNYFDGVHQSDNHTVTLKQAVTTAAATP